MTIFSASCENATFAVPGVCRALSAAEEEVIGMDGPGTPESEAKEPARYQGVMPNFRATQAAVAWILEFNATVAAVHTGRFRDHQRADLDSRNVSIIQMLQEETKEGNHSRAGRNTLRKELVDGSFTEEELKARRAGRPAQSFRCLGAARG